MRGYMKDIRAALSGVTEAAESTEEKEDKETPAQRVAERLRAMLWPERALELKRQRAMTNVMKEVEVEDG